MPCIDAAQISEGHRRNAITYTALICAAEKAGQWQLALELFHRVAADGVGPNAAIFNAAMSACAQGAWPLLKGQYDSRCYSSPVCFVISRLVAAGLLSVLLHGS